MYIKSWLSGFLHHIEIVFSTFQQMFPPAIIRRCYRCFVALRKAIGNVSTERGFHSELFSQRLPKPGFEPATFGLRVRHSNHYATGNNGRFFMKFFYLSYSVKVLLACDWLNFYVFWLVDFSSRGFQILLLISILGLLMSWSLSLCVMCKASLIFLLLVLN